MHLDLYDQVDFGPRNVYHGRIVQEMVISYVYPFYLFTAYSSSGPVQA